MKLDHHASFRKLPIKIMLLLSLSSPFRCSSTRNPLNSDEWETLKRRRRRLHYRLVADFTRRRSNSSPTTSAARTTTIRYHYNRRLLILLLQRQMLISTTQLRRSIFTISTPLSFQNWLVLASGIGGGSGIGIATQRGLMVAWRREKFEGGLGLVFGRGKVGLGMLWEMAVMLFWVGGNASFSIWRNWVVELLLGLIGLCMSMPWSTVLRYLLQFFWVNFITDCIWIWVNYLF